MKFDHKVAGVVSVGLLCGVLSITAMEQGSSSGSGAQPLSAQDEPPPMSLDEAKKYLDSYLEHSESPKPLDDEPGFYFGALDNLHRVKMGCMKRRDKILGWIAEADLFPERVFDAGFRGTGGKEEGLAIRCSDVAKVYNTASRLFAMHTFDQEMVHRFGSRPDPLDTVVLDGIEKAIEDSYDKRMEYSHAEQRMFFAGACPEYAGIRARSKSPVDVKRHTVGFVWGDLAAAWGMPSDEAMQLFADRGVADLYQSVDVVECGESVTSES